MLRIQHSFSCCLIDYNGIVQSSNRSRKTNTSRTQNSTQRIAVDGRFYVSRHWGPSDCSFRSDHGQQSCVDPAALQNVEQNPATEERVRDTSLLEQRRVESICILSAPSIKLALNPHTRRARATAKFDLPSSNQYSNSDQ